mmetsp:Transcript_62466/g.183122  ORF Transcript_62466/g.183122 Transcript_62466/m.183122 type:complete len:90 (-) Transcript_62466:199-468(-)
MESKPSTSSPKKAGAKLLSTTLPCKYFGSAKGCNFGDDCVYKHDDTTYVAPCKNHGARQCKFGDKCFFRHTELESPKKSLKGGGKGSTS